MFRRHFNLIFPAGLCTCNLDLYPLMYLSMLSICTVNTISLYSTPPPRVKMPCPTISARPWTLYNELNPSPEQSAPTKNYPSYMYIYSHSFTCSVLSELCSFCPIFFVFTFIMCQTMLHSEKKFCMLYKKNVADFSRDNISNGRSVWGLIQKGTMCWQNELQ